MHFAVRAAGAAGTVSCGTPGLGTRPDYPLNPAVFSYAQPDRGIYVSLSTARLGGSPLGRGSTRVGRGYILDPSHDPMMKPSSEHERRAIRHNRRDRSPDPSRVALFNLLTRGMRLCTSPSVLRGQQGRFRVGLPAWEQDRTTH
ncbi:hypothetical protein RR46_04268 [Papilio xuthus]|uniref:Uncharacterized protein n=1 Tax=Papilio xuthus TaxID=66420 RepID=A0A194QJM7_PAPXU|nr:hypothetical protein RR46_04268 [Papilio xuthus]